MSGEVAVLGLHKFGVALENMVVGIRSP